MPRSAATAGPSVWCADATNISRLDEGKRMPSGGVKRVGVIKASMVGVCAASWLQRDGHSVFLVEADEPGHNTSFGNAGCFNGSSVTPLAMPGVMRNVTRWLFDLVAPYALVVCYLPTLAT